MCTNFNLHALYFLRSEPEMGAQGHAYGPPVNTLVSLPVVLCFMVLLSSGHLLLLTNHKHFTNHCLHED